MKKTVVALSAVAFLGLAGIAQAKCSKSNTSFVLSKNQNVTIVATTDNGICTHEYITATTFGFSSANVVSSPSRGTLAQTGGFEFIYRANPGFKGRDGYAIKVCGHDKRGTGCSVLTYQAIVK